MSKLGFIQGFTAKPTEPRQPSRTDTDMRYLIYWRDCDPTDPPCTSSGMAAALPHLDMFAAANTLESLASLERELEWV